MIGMGVLSVAAFMAVAILCPFVFFRFPRREVKSGDESALDGRFSINPGRWEALVPKSADLFAAV
jgi:hypothetical protein